MRPAGKHRSARGSSTASTQGKYSLSLHPWWCRFTQALRFDFFSTTLIDRSRSLKWSTDTIQLRLKSFSLAATARLALNPGFTIRRLRASKPSDNPTFLAGRERLYSGMRLAGVPEG
jgi:hypothetical protein